MLLQSYARAGEENRVSGVLTLTSADLRFVAERPERLSFNPVSASSGLQKLRLPVRDIVATRSERIRPYRFIPLKMRILCVAMADGRQFEFVVPRSVRWATALRRAAGISSEGDVDEHR